MKSDLSDDLQTVIRELQSLERDVDSQGLHTIAQRLYACQNQLLGIKSIAGNEQRRIVGIVLKRYAEAKLAGALDIADALDKLATEIEHGA